MAVSMIQRIKNVHAGFLFKARFLCQSFSQSSSFLALLLSPCWPMICFILDGLYLSTHSKLSSDWPDFWGLAVRWELCDDWLLPASGEDWEDLKRLSWGDSVTFGELFTLGEAVALDVSFSWKMLKRIKWYITSQDDFCFLTLWPLGDLKEIWEK